MKHKKEAHQVYYHGNVNFQNFQTRPVIFLEGSSGWFVLKVQLYRYKHGIFT